MDVLLVIMFLFAASAVSAQYFDPPPDMNLEDPYPEGVIEAQFSPNPFSKGNSNIIELVLKGTLLLSNVDMGANPPVASFCHYDFDTQHKSNPSSVPTFLDLVSSSLHCNEHLSFLPLSEVADAARASDSANLSGLHPMDLGGFIFHQPKSGSSLLSNAITAAGNRVLSEPNALANILRCRHCSESLISKSLLDVIYLLSRAPVGNSNQNKKVYIKLISTANLELVRQSYPLVNYAFVYREPDVVVQKLMNNNAYRRSCGFKQRVNPSLILRDYLHEHDLDDVSLLDDSTLCAAGVAVNMLTLVDNPALQYDFISYETMLTEKGMASAMHGLGVPIGDSEARGVHRHLTEIRTRRANVGRHEVFHAEKDAVSVTDLVKKANERFLVHDLKRRQFEVDAA